MLAAFIVMFRSLALIVAGHRAVALEHLALRQQLAALTRRHGRPQLRTEGSPPVRHGVPPRQSVNS